MGCCPSHPSYRGFFDLPHTLSANAELLGYFMQLAAVVEPGFDDAALPWGQVAHQLGNLVAGVDRSRGFVHAGAVVSGLIFQGAKQGRFFLACMAMPRRTHVKASVENWKPRVGSKLRAALKRNQKPTLTSSSMPPAAASAPP
jgi:hypothetical protein